jgi:hypothetical protein
MLTVQVPPTRVSYPVAQPDCKLAKFINNLKKKKKVWALVAAWKAEIQRTVDQSQPWANSSETPSPK